MKKKVLIITGAGLTAGKDFFGINTLGITEKFLQYNHPKLSSDKNLIRFIYETFCSKHKLNPSNVASNLYQINFETILQMVEELHSYVEDVEKTELKAKYQNSVKSSIFKFRKEILDYFNEARIYKGLHPLYLFIEKIHNHLIDILIEEINPHNNDSKNIGMNGFNKFLNTSFPKLNYSKRVYSLNYDNWLNRYGGYYDGFEGTDFDIKKVIKDRIIDCQYNLHGCILWEWFSAKKLATPKLIKNFQSGNEPTISREALLPTPIISGYNKLTRIHSLPFLQIFHSLINDVIEMDSLLIIGYSFSDPHINEILRMSQIDLTIVIVIYSAEKELDNAGSELQSLLFLIGDIFKTSFLQARMSSQAKHTIISDDGRISIFINGIGNEFYSVYQNCQLN